MPARFLMFALAFALLFTTFSAATAQVDDDDDDIYTSGVEFLTPSDLQPSTQYNFSFMAVNGAAPSYYSREWIYQVDLVLPSDDYVLDETNLTAPNPLHPADVQKWEVEFDYNNTMISWMTVAGHVSSGEVGDIRESESLMFEFVATTDSEATDGFFWWLTTDQGTVINGISYIGDGPLADDDDNDDLTDDDDYSLDDDDDDDDFNVDDSDEDPADDEDSDGCGC